MCKSGRVNLCCQRFDQFANIRRFDMVIVYLVSDGLKSGFKCGIAGQYEIHTFRLRASHRTYHCEAVSRLTDIQVCNESVEVLRTDCLKGLGNRSGDGYVKTLMSQYRWKCEADVWFVIDEENPERHRTSYRKGANRVLRSPTLACVLILLASN